MYTPISYTMIHKGDPNSILKCIRSLIQGERPMYREGDEFVVVDTGSTVKQVNRLRSQLAKLSVPFNVIARPDLSVPYEPLIRQYFNDNIELLDEFKQATGSGKGILDFAAARQLSLEAATKEFIMWIDSDDVFYDEGGPVSFRDAVQQAIDKGCSAVFMDYQYSFAEDGTCITTLRRERVVRKALYRWAGRCHETLIPVEGANQKAGDAAFFQDVRAGIRHTDARKPHRISDIRNYVIMRHELEQEGEKTDPRTIFYLGNASRGLADFRQSLHFYKMFDGLSGSIDDRFAALYYTAIMYMDPKMRRPFDALDTMFECIKLKPYDPRGYFGISYAYAQVCRWEECVRWYEIGRGLQMPKTELFSYDPTHIHYKPHCVAAKAYKELGNVPKMMEAATAAYNYRPNFPEAQQLVMEAKNEAAGIRLLESVTTCARNCPDQSASVRIVDTLCSELAVIPPKMEEMGLGRTEGPDPRETRPELAIICPGVGEKWGAFSRNIGIGGSEKMVILLAEALQARGTVNVSVYCDCPSHVRGVAEDTGVLWRHWSEFDRKRPRHTVVYWRCPEWVHKLPVPAEKRVIWNHDVQDPSRYTQAVLAIADLVQVQSKYHAQPLQGVVPPEQLWIARNATELPVKTKKRLPRDPKQIVYCSSWDRGVTTAMAIFEAALAKDPELTLCITYGITPWARKLMAKNFHRFVPDLGHDVSLDLFEREVHKMADRIGPRVKILNRVNFAQMSVLLQSSGVWLYPTRFPEISCMSAMEAQLSGCVPVCTDFGALAETVLPEARALVPALPALPASGLPEAYVQEAAELLLRATAVPEDDPRRAALSKAAFKAFDVWDLSAQWLTTLGLPTSPPSAAGCGEGNLGCVPPSPAPLLSGS